MPITFGSVGDIIAVCLLVKDLVEALDDARGSRREYRFVIRQLRVLDRTLLEIDLLTKALDNATTLELQGFCTTAKDAATQCKTLVDAFLERVKGYKKSFDEGQNPGILRDAIAKVRWRIGEKEALERFRNDIANATSNLQMLLATASVALLNVNRKEFENRFTTLDQQSVYSNAQQAKALEQVRQGIDSAQRQIDIGNTLLNQISNTLQLDWLRKMGSELKGLIRRVITMNIATYHAVISIQAALPDRIERPLIEEPFILEDPIGRIFPVHLKFVTCWEAFHAVMEIQFSNVQGLRKMQERQYGLQEGSTRREIEQTKPWQRAFLPGQRVEMAFIFQSKSVKDPDATNMTCPGCQTPSCKPNDEEIQCQGCSMSYRRITIVEDGQSTLGSRQPELRTSIKGSATQKHKRVIRPDIEREDDIREFKRVRLVQTEKWVSSSFAETARGISKKRQDLPDKIPHIAGPHSNDSLDSNASLLSSFQHSLGRAPMSRVLQNVDVPWAAPSASEYHEFGLQLIGSQSQTGDNLPVGLQSDVFDAARNTDIWTPDWQHGGSRHPSPKLRPTYPENNLLPQHLGATALTAFTQLSPDTGSLDQISWQPPHSSLPQHSPHHLLDHTQTPMIQVTGTSGDSETPDFPQPVLAAWPNYIQDASGPPRNNNNDNNNTDFAFYNMESLLPPVKNGRIQLPQLPQLPLPIPKAGEHENILSRV